MKGILFETLDEFHAYDGMSYEEIKIMIYNQLKTKVMTEEERIDKFFEEKKKEAGGDTGDKESEADGPKELDEFFKGLKEEMKY